MGELPTLEQWARETQREASAFMAARGILRQIRRQGYALGAVFQRRPDSRAFAVVEQGGRECRERLREERGCLIGVYTPDVDVAYIAEDVEEVL